jgi:ABC-type multidrug transport system ATPase subunit|mmetsp:Transcript_40150/g.72085  ORF Transcript_40150/g.72085 Transcript_40150/m.72085 type:complete len:91 (-) Transcript_40150:43-315(-)
MRADKIVVMHHGELAEEGTHAELMALGGRFASLWSKQQEAAEDSGMQRSSSLAHVRELESCKLFAAMRGAQESTDGDNDDLAILNRSNTI